MLLSVEDAESYCTCSVVCVADLITYTCKTEVDKKQELC